jgi:predicted LPLAT superfamily acyltransferase
LSTFWEHQRERGTRAAVRLLIAASAIFGRGIIRLVLWPIAAYFLVSSPAAVRASKGALCRLLAREPGTRDVFRHFLCFAQCAVDRFFLLRGQQQQFEIVATRPAEVAAVADHGKGCVMLLAHLGSFEAMRMMGAAAQALPITVLMDRHQGQMLVEMLERINPAAALHIVDAAERGPALMLKLKEALEAGRMVCIMADRARADERALRVEFCGGTVRFPLGPWALAAALGVPVIIGFGLYRGGNRYTANFELFAERLMVQRSERDTELQACAQRYAQRLEYYARQAPYNWFNFFDYWADESGRSS